jgi:NADPH2 dehydrogenase
MSKLFSSFKVKNIELKNRIVMAPMCMYSAENDGLAKDWHCIHYVTRAMGGVGLIIQEATAVESRGRISDRDLGIWEDSQTEGLKRVVSQVKKNGAVMGIQLAHAGRKCEVVKENIIAPSAIAFNESYQIPSEMSKADIRDVVEAFKAGAKRAAEAGYDVIELHGAHGYLINEFLSPLSNKRIDQYGGSAENRARFLKEVLAAVREVWPMEKAIILRVSAEDYAESGNHSQDLAEMVNIVKSEGLDIIHVSSGAVVPTPIKVYPGYQVKFAEIIKEKTGLPVIAGGLITTAEMAEEIVQNNRADLVFLARELLRNPYWALKAAYELKDEIAWPEQYERGKFRK